MFLREPLPVFLINYLKRSFIRVLRAVAHERDGTFP